MMAPLIAVVPPTHEPCKTGVKAAALRRLKPHVAPHALVLVYMSLRSSLRRHVRPLFEDDDLEARFGEHTGRRRPARAASDDDHVGDVVDASCESDVVEA